MTSKSGYFQPALVGGLVSGVLSALPVVSAGNICCCLWVVTGALLAVYLLQQNRSEAITAIDGAVVGLLAGVIGAVIQFALSIPIGLIVGPLERQVLERLRAVAGSAPDAVGPGAIGTVLIRIIGFFIALVVGAVVSTVAGIIGAAVFARRREPTPSGQS